ncbi:MAG TPA: fatty acid desaturase [Pseudomonadales bacterium]|nr:fatty acid desaturase [Pseudomonadales bacterium]
MSVLYPEFFHKKLFRYRDGVLPNLLAFAYAFGGYAAGWWLIAGENWLANAAGVLVLAHAMIIAAYLIHECAHNTLFADNANNARFGAMLLWLTGACYGTYEGLRHKHFRHHVDRADVVAFNFRTRLLQYPMLLRVLQILEWAYIPAVDLVMHWLVPVMPFVLPKRKTQRSHVITVLLVRGSLFALVGLYAPMALLFYAVSYMLMLHVLRFMDAFQHTYELFATLEQERGPEARQFDEEFEATHTYSNLHSTKYPLLNLFTLNFGYHNAHHEKPNQPWHRLPALHANLFGDSLPQLIPFKHQIACYHRYRVQRMAHEDAVDFDVVGNQGATFVGVDGVSFLTGH